MKKVITLLLCLFICFGAFAQYKMIHPTENTKDIVLKDLPNVVYHNLGKVGDGLFFLNDKLYDIDGNLIASNLNIYNSISGNAIPVFSCGRAIFDDGRKMGIMDKTGKVIWSADHNYGYSISEKFVEGYAIKVTVKQGIPYAEYIDINGRPVFSNLTRSCSYGSQMSFQPFVDGLSLFYDSKASAYGFINEKGTIVIPAKYRLAHPFSDGLAAVRDDSGNWGFIDKNGKTVIDFIFSREPEDFKEGFAIAEKNDGSSVGWGEKVFINKQGEVVSSGWYKRIIRVGKFKLANPQYVENGTGHVLGENCEEVATVSERYDLFPGWLNERGWPYVLESGDLLTRTNLRSKDDLEVIFISKADYPVKGDNDYWYELYDAGDGYFWICDNNANIHGIVNRDGEILIRFKKSEF